MFSIQRTVLYCTVPAGRLGTGLANPERAQSSCCAGVLSAVLNRPVQYSHVERCGRYCPPFTGRTPGRGGRGLRWGWNGWQGQWGRGTAHPPPWLFGCLQYSAVMCEGAVTSLTGRAPPRREGERVGVGLAGLSRVRGGEALRPSQPRGWQRASNEVARSEESSEASNGPSA